MYLLRYVKYEATISSKAASLNRSSKPPKKNVRKAMR
jgi:hypothetical protein